MIEVKTGEEEEEELFNERAKLFRHCGDSKAWKERGIGNIKILAHSGGKKYRIVMRREHVLKLCANHAITREMKLLPHSSDRHAWCWFAQDFSEEEVKREQLAVKFKSADVHAEFKRVFDQCHEDLGEKPATSPAAVAASADKTDTAAAPKDAQQSSVKPLSQLFKPKSGSWECNGCYVRNEASVTKCVACNTTKPGAEPEQSDQVSSSTGSSTSKLVFGSGGSSGGGGVTFGSGTSAKTGASSGFKFGSASSTVTSSAGSSGFTFGTPSKSDVKASGDASKGGFQFSFGAPSSSAPSSNGDGSKAAAGFTFNLNDSKVTSPPKSSPKPQQEPTSPGDGYYINHESEDAHIYFEPIVPLPEKVVVKTGEEQEDCLFSARAKLYRFATNEWKERGIGDMKILRRKDDHAQSRLLMRREQILKICCNHKISADLDLKPMDKQARQWVWHANDFSESEGKHEKFAVRFREAATAEEFKKVFDEAKEKSKTKKLKDPSSEKEVKADSEKSSLHAFSFQMDEEQLKKSPLAPPKFKFQSPTASPASSSTGGDVEFLYEEKPSAALVARARRFLLPDSFYLYELRPPCPGCIGCEDGEDNLTRDSSKTTVIEELTKTSELARLLTSPTDSSDKTSGSAMSAASVFGGSAGFGSSPSFLNMTADSSSETSQSGGGLFSSSLSFASIASSSDQSGGFAKKDPSKPFSWSGAGQVLFGGKKAGGEADNGEDEDETGDGEVEQCADIHFEPIVELPKLVEVKTGEEGEEVIFSQRSKVYRFDKDQWKERGVGELKILKNSSGRFRILLRRDQVLKVALNHLLTPDMELKPMMTSEKALCWFAVDYSENEPINGQFAVKFKTIALRDEFKDVFENCQNILAEQSVSADKDNQEVPVQTLGATPDVVQTTQVVSSKPDTGDSGGGTVKPSSNGAAAAAAAQGYDQVEEEEEDEDEEQIVFQKRATLQCLDNVSAVWKNLGQGEMTVTHDDDVDGMSIRMVNAQGKKLCNHIICMETRMTINEKQKSCEWTALDFSTDEPDRKTLKAIFSSASAANDFYATFTTGVQMAHESQVSERKDQATFPREITFPEVVGVAEGEGATGGLQGTCSPDLTAALESLTTQQNKG